MYEKRNDVAATDNFVDPLKLLTRAQFAALGGDAVAYVREVNGAILAQLVDTTEFDHAQAYQLVMSADGKPLMVSDTHEGVLEWLGEKQLGIATLH
jgi:hypothetical protein